MTAADPSPAVDLLGRRLTGDEAELLELYGRVRRLLRADLDPCARANVRVAAVGLWNAANDLALDVALFADDT